MHDPIFDASLAGIYVVDLVEKRHLSVNRAYTEITGYSLADLAAMTPDRFLERFHEDDRAQVLRHLDELLTAEPGVAVDFMYRFQAADGRWLHCASRHVPVRRATDGVREVVGSFVETVGARRARSAAAEPPDREATAQLDALFSAAPVGLGFWDTSLRFKRLNGKLAQMNGLPAEAHLGRRPDELFPNIQALDTIMERWRQLLATGMPWTNVEVTGTTRASSGTRIWREHFFPVAIDSTIVGLGAVVEDVTERRHAQRALLESEQSLRAFIEHSPLMTGIVELAEDESDLLHVIDSATTERFFGVGAGGTAGRWAKRDLGATEETVRSWGRMYRQAQLRLTPVRFTHVASSGGTRQTLDAFVTYIGRGENGRDRFCYSAVDDTERFRIEEALRASDRHKSDFLAILGHELRNPLAPLHAGLELLRRGAPEATRQEQVIEIMHRQVQLLVRLVDDMLDVASIGRGTIALALRLVDLREALRAALEQTTERVAARGHSIRVAEAPEALLVHGDLGRLTQVFANLLSNACRYTAPGGSIDVSLRGDGEHAVASIRDSGRGIAEEHLESIFQLFSRVADESDESTRGFGVGLALVRRLVALHGGTVSARSDGAGRGSEFTVRLPLAPHGREGRAGT